MKYRVEWQTGAIDLEVQTDSLGQEWSVDDPDGRNWRFRTRPIEGQTVTRMIVGTQFKRRMPLIAKVALRSVGWDFRYPRDWLS